MKKFARGIIFFFASTSFFSCSEDKNPCKLPESVLKDIAKIDSIVKMPETRKRDSIWKYNNYKEPSLLSAQNETYRFISSSSFGGTKIYRIEKNKDHYTAILKFLADKDTIAVVKEFSISQNTWNDIVAKLAGDGFWTYPSTITRNGLDGETWTLEAYKPYPDKCTGKKFHVVSRWSPADTLFISMCSLFYYLKEE